MTLDQFRSALKDRSATAEDLIELRKLNGWLAIVCRDPSERANVLQFFVDNGLGINYRDCYLYGGSSYKNMIFPHPGFSPGMTVTCFTSDTTAPRISYDDVAYLIDPWWNDLETGDFSADVSALYL